MTGVLRLQRHAGGISYENSATQGTAAVVRAVTQFNARCPETKIVLIGYSQGGQIMDNALCGGAGATLTGAALEAVKAAIFMGDPHNVRGLPYNVGTCQAQGVSHVIIPSHPKRTLVWGSVPLEPRSSFRLEEDGMSRRVKRGAEVLVAVPPRNCSKRPIQNWRIY